MALPPSSALMRLSFFVALVLLLLPPGSAAETASKWEAQVAALESSHHQVAPPKHAVLFIGSSSIRGWRDIAKDFPDLPVINHGFGGSQISDSIVYFERLVLPFKPRLVVFYAGTNDLAAGKSSETVAADFRAFCAKMHTSLPETKILFIGLVMAPARWELREKMALTNTLIAAFCASDPRRALIDLNPHMMTPDGQARLDLYIGDRLHMNRRGYKIWQEALNPLLR